MDQLTAIVRRHDAHTGWQRRFNIVDLAFDAVDDVEGVLAIPHHYDSTDDFPVAVQLRYSAPERAAEMHLADVLDVNRRAVFDFEHDVLDVLDAFEITTAAHEIFRRRNLDSFSAHVA